MNQIETARSSRVSSEVEMIARQEGVPAQNLMALVAAGKVIITTNSKRPPKKLVGIGKGLRTKVNANIGTSTDFQSLDGELEKLAAAESAGTDTIMDLSTGGDIRAVRRAIIEKATVPVGSVPIYEAGVTAAKRRGSVLEMTAGDMLEGLRAHIEDGVAFVTLHCGVTRRVVDVLKRNPRLCGIVSRGGTFLAHWISRTKQENPFYERYDEVLGMLKEADVTLSLGDGLRPGAIADSFDAPQVAELVEMAGLAERALKAGVQVMIEGPGHVPLNQIETNILLQKRLCHGAPFYVLGPLVTDIAPGYDHITCAIGGAMAAAAGADFLCYVTPSEHLRLPTVEDVREGVMAARIAAHAGDIAKGVKGAMEKDSAMARCRKKLDWEGQFDLAIDPEKARRLRAESGVADHGACTMCGEFCAYKVMDDAMGKEESK